MLKHGKNLKGKQRWLCKRCRKTFIFSTCQKLKKSKYFNAFLSWISNGLTLNYLSQTLGCSISTLWRHFSYWLDKPLTSYVYLNQVIASYVKLAELKGILCLDAGYWGKNSVLIYVDYHTRYPLFYRVSDGEYTDQIYSDLFLLCIKGYPLRAVVSDGKLTIAKAIQRLNKQLLLKGNYLQIKHQLCVAHTQRTCQTYLTLKPKTKAGKELKKLVDGLTSVKSHRDKDIWFKKLKSFEDQYLSFISQRTIYSETKLYKKSKNLPKLRWRYTHKYLRRAYTHLTKHLDKLFLYLDDSLVPKTNNVMEGLMSALKLWSKRHRGLRSFRFNSLIFYLLTYRFLKQLGLKTKTIGVKILSLI